MDLVWARVAIDAHLKRSAARDRAIACAFVDSFEGPADCNSHRGGMKASARFPVWAAMLASVAPAAAAATVTGWSRDALAQPATSAVASSAVASSATGPFAPGTSASGPSENELPVPVAMPPVRLGAIAGVGFPHPLAVEALAEFSGYVAVGAEYGALPAVTIDNVRTSLWSLSADVRVFPFRGAFFIGLRAGRQHVEATTTVTIMSLGSATEVLDLDAWF